MTIVRGSCLCKQVHYEVEMPFEHFYFCHCSRCRKATGSAHAANGFVRPQAFRWTGGEELLRRYDLPEAQRFGLQFCGQCGSRMPRFSRDGASVVIPAGSLDEDPLSRPEAIIFWGSRAPWFMDCSQLKQFDELPE